MPSIIRELHKVLTCGAVITILAVPGHAASLGVGGVGGVSVGGNGASANAGGASGANADASFGGSSTSATASIGGTNGANAAVSLGGRSRGSRNAGPAVRLCRISCRIAAMAGGALTRTSGQSGSLPPLAAGFC